MTIHQIISNHVVVDEIAKYLSPKVVLFARLVSPTWTAAYEKAFIKTVPVILDDLEIKEFTVLESGMFRPRRMKNEAFRLRTRLTKKRKTAAVLDFCKKFAPQIVRLEIVYATSSNSMAKGFYQVLSALKDTLESLKVCMQDWDTGSYGEKTEICTFPVMSRLKSLSFVMDSDPNGEKDDYNMEGGECLASLVTKSCPNLEHLTINGFSNLQEAIFKKLKRTGKTLKLESMTLKECSLLALIDLSTIQISPTLKHLCFLPSCDMYGPILDSVIPVSINKFLKNVANGLTSLDLRLKAVFEEAERDNPNWDPLDHDEEIDQVLLTLPVMPKLRSLRLEVLDPGESSFEYDPDGHFDIRFEEPLNEHGNSPCLKRMYPELVELRFINWGKIDLAEGMISPHEGIKLFEVKRDSRRNRVKRKLKMKELLQAAAEAFPNAKVKVP